jgi:hypothetical protein
MQHMNEDHNSEHRKLNYLQSQTSQLLGQSTDPKLGPKGL